MRNIIGCYSIPDNSDSSYPSLIHDHSICIFENGKIKNYLHTERLTRKKYDAGLNKIFAKVARELKIIPSKGNLFVFVDHEIGRASISSDGQIRLEAAPSEYLQVNPEEARLYWFGERPEAMVINHELAHLYSCVPFYGMFKENSLLVHFDGGASLSNFSAWTYTRGKINLHEAGYSLTWLSSLFNANALVFAMVGAKKHEQNSVPGKFMGLEAYGSYSKKIENWLRAHDFFKDIWTSKKMFFRSLHENFNIKLEHISLKTPIIMDIAATIHEIFVMESCKVFERLVKETNTGYLYFTGGSALNIKLTRRLVEMGIFKDIFIPPCTNDSGLSIGAAVAGAIHLGQEVPVASPYLNNYGLPGYDEFNYSDSDVGEHAVKIKNGEIIGLCNGFGEVGPRALGNRSIVARADNKALAKKISQHCKGREWYRPIAPVILERNLKRFTNSDSAPQLARYMLIEFNLSELGRKEMAGCAHVDGTARIQVIPSRETNPYLYDLLDKLEKEYNIYALINTSFNAKGEPIVHTHEQAVLSASRMGLDGVVLNGKFKKTPEI